MGFDSKISLFTTLTKATKSIKKSTHRLRDPNIFDPKGNTLELLKRVPIDIIKKAESRAQNGFELGRFLTAYLDFYEEKAELVLIQKVCDAGANPSYENGLALQLAIEHGLFDIGSYLIKAGCDINANDHFLIRNTVDMPGLKFLLTHDALIPESYGKILRSYLELDEESFELLFLCKKPKDVLSFEDKIRIVKMEPNQIGSVRPFLSIKDLMKIHEIVEKSLMPSHFKGPVKAFVISH